MVYIIIKRERDATTQYCYTAFRWGHRAESPPSGAVGCGSMTGGVEPQGRRSDRSGQRLPIKKKIEIICILHADSINPFDTILLF